MQYMGGKTMVAKHIVRAIMDDTDARDIWYEPFVGGGNVLERACPHFRRSVGTDIHPDLILMWDAIKAGYDPPEFVSKEEYDCLRRSDPSALRGYAGFAASFGGKWFGGYGTVKVDRKHPNAEVCRSSHRVVLRQAEVFRAHDVRFQCRAFGDLTPPPGAVVYCDPPYAGTTRYSTGEFDYTSFYSTLQGWAALGCDVYVSEYTVPESVPHTVVWSREKRNVLEKRDNQRVALELLCKIQPAAATESLAA